MLFCGKSAPGKFGMAIRWHYCGYLRALLEIDIIA